MTSVKTMKVGIAQIDSTIGALRDNAANHRKYIEEARAQGVETLLFPELSLTGYDLNHNTQEVALYADDPLIKDLAEVAQGITVILGFVEEGPAAQFYNAAIVLRDGAIQFKHRKINLPTYGNLHEGKWFASGRYVETVELTRQWRAGLLICADLWNPALVNLASMHGATMLLAPINSAVDAVSTEFSNPHGWDLASRFYAMIYGMPVVIANRIGLENGARFWGGSRIIDPYGTVLADAGEAETLITADLDFEAVRTARVQLPTVRDSNFGLVQREMNRLEDILGIPRITGRL